MKTSPWSRRSLAGSPPCEYLRVKRHVAESLIAKRNGISVQVAGDDVDGDVIFDAFPDFALFKHGGMPTRALAFHAADAAGVIVRTRFLRIAYTSPYTAVRGKSQNAKA